MNPGQSEIHSFFNFFNLYYRIELAGMQQRLGMGTVTAAPPLEQGRISQHQKSGCSLEWGEERRLARGGEGQKKDGQPSISLSSGLTVLTIPLGRIYRTVWCEERIPTSAEPPPPATAGITASLLQKDHRHHSARNFSPPPLSHWLT